MKVIHRLGYGALAAAMLCALPAQALSQKDRPKRTLVSVLNGSCKSLVVAGAAGDGRCGPKLIGIVYPTQDVSFVFRTSDGRLVSFKGRPEAASEDETTLNVRQVTTVGRATAGPAVANVVGSCVFRGVAFGPNQLRCEAADQNVRYSAAFATKGDDPARFLF